MYATIKGSATADRAKASLAHFPRAKMAANQQARSAVAAFQNHHKTKVTAELDDSDVWVVLHGKSHPVEWDTWEE